MTSKCNNILFRLVHLWTESSWFLTRWPGNAIKQSTLPAVASNPSSVLVQTATTPIQIRATPTTDASTTLHISFNIHHDIIFKWNNFQSNIPFYVLFHLLWLMQDCGQLVYDPTSQRCDIIPCTITTTSTEYATTDSTHSSWFF